MSKNKYKAEEPLKMISLKDDCPPLYSPLIAVNSKGERKTCWAASDGDHYIFTCLNSMAIFSDVTHFIL